jgi:hypothetical protein
LDSHETAGRATKLGSRADPNCPTLVYSVRLPQRHSHSLGNSRNTANLLDGYICPQSHTPNPASSQSRKVPPLYTPMKSGTSTEIKR